MHLEYNWTFCVYQPRVGASFTDIRGVRSYATLREARDHLASIGLALGKKTDSRTWRIDADGDKKD